MFLLCSLIETDAYLYVKYIQPPEPNIIYINAQKGCPSIVIINTWPPIGLQLKFGAIVNLILLRPVNTCAMILLDERFRTYRCNYYYRGNRCSITYDRASRRALG